MVSEGGRGYVSFKSLFSTSRAGKGGFLREWVPQGRQDWKPISLEESRAGLGIVSRLCPISTQRKLVISSPDNLPVVSCLSHGYFLDIPTLFVVYHSLCPSPTSLTSRNKECVVGWTRIGGSSGKVGLLVLGGGPAIQSHLWLVKVMEGTEATLLPGD